MTYTPNAPLGLRRRIASARRCSAFLVAIGVLGALLARPGLADQQITLRTGWNLVAVSVVPANSAVATVLDPIIASGRFLAVWSYDAQTATWSRYPSTPGVPTITNLEAGKGYWLKLTSQTSLTIAEAATGTPPAPTTLYPSWNLVSFAVDEPTGFEKVFRNLSIDQIWRFNSTIGAFEGIQIVGGQATFPAFTEIEPGRAYWVRSSAVGPISSTPLLASALRSDTDLEPLLPDPAPGQQLVWSPFTPGDFDVEGDGLYDRPDTQRALDFLDSIDVQTVGLSNAGAGVLNWRISVGDPVATPWLSIRTLDPDTGEETRFETLAGSTTTESDLVEILIDREGLAPGDYQGQIIVQSNGGASAFPVEPTRAIPIAMQVDGVGGDYQVRVEIETVDGTDADLPNPRLFLSLYNDGQEALTSDDNRLKAIIDASRTLLFPKNVRMVGSVYQDDSARFTVSGSFELPLDNPVDLDDGNNPYNTPIRREITLIGDRRNRADPQDALLGPLDLKGEYRETIRDLFDNPIYIRGRFEATRLSQEPSALDGSTLSCGGGAIGPIPDNGQRDITLVAPSQILLTEVDVTVTLTHTRASDVRLTLISPQGEQVLLRSGLAGNTGQLTYDETAVPVDSLAVYQGTLSQSPTSTDWRLRVQDTSPGESGTIAACSINLAGTRVNDISGNVAGAGAGVDVLLTGCGVTQSTTTDSSGNYRFDDLVDCLYRVTVTESGLQSTSRDVSLAGADLAGQHLAPAAITPPPPNPIAPSTDGTYTLSSISTLSGAGALSPRGRLRYVHDSATFDVDRPPLGLPTGDEDTTEFQGLVWPCTQTNRPNFDGAEPPCVPVVVGSVLPPLLFDTVVDPPVGTGLHVRAFNSIGGAVAGQSVSGNLRLQVGANP